MDAQGRVQNLRVVSNNANEAFANICLQSFQEARIPPIPPDLIATLPEGRMAVDITFTTLRKPMMTVFSAPSMTETIQTMVGFFTKGGLFMWPLLACSIVTVTTLVLSILTLREKKVLPLVIESEIERLTPGGSAERLMRIVNDDNSSLASVVRTALQHLRWPRAENIESVQTRARRELVRLERGLIVLEVVTGIAPLIGLIGTVAGLVHVFSGLGVNTGASDTKAVALGISEALNCTIFGLSIAVPALIGFSYFSKKIEVMSVEMESLVSDLIAKCYYGRVPSGEAVAAAENHVASAGPRACRVNHSPLVLP